MLIQGYEHATQRAVAIYSAPCCVGRVSI